jgi:hypothetical protein
MVLEEIDHAELYSSSPCHDLTGNQQQRSGSVAHPLMGKQEH